MDIIIECADVVIVGAGSGGFGAAVRAARANPAAKIIVIEAMNQFGGTSTAGGVNNWEPGIAGLGVHRELYGRLKAIGAIGSARTIHFSNKQEPYGFSRIDPDCTYASTLRRSGLPSKQWRRVHFEPDSMSQEMERMLREAGQVDIRYETKCVGVRTEGNRITSILVQSLHEKQPYEIRGRYFLDCSGGVHMARMAGCQTAFGEDSAEAFGEPSAPAVPDQIVNGVTQVYRVERVAAAAAADEPALPQTEEYEAALAWVEGRRPSTFIAEYPNGDLNMNVLPIMEGREFFSMPEEVARETCRARARVHWHWFRQFAGFEKYRFKGLFPLAGIRESHRLVGRYVLREQDVRAGLFGQERAEECIAYADHALDTHGHTNVQGGHIKELERPYGVPYSCMLPKEFDNLIVASRGASFSHIAASSCRLSRTMMDLGEAAGLATAIALERGCPYGEVPIKTLKEELRIPEYREHIVEEWKLNV